MSQCHKVTIRTSSRNILASNITDTTMVYYGSLLRMNIQKVCDIRGRLQKMAQISGTMFGSFKENV
mgnify:CR=1 FL=1